MSVANETKSRTLRLKCSYDEMSRLHQFLHDASFEILGVHADKELISTITLATHEAFTNIVRHAYADSPKKDVVIHCRAQKDGIEVELVDHGIEFHPLKPPAFFDDPLFEKIQEAGNLDDLDESQILGGYGIPIIQAATTSTQYHRSPSGENHLSLHFKIPKFQTGVQNMSSSPKTLENVTIVQPPASILDTRNVSEFRDSLHPILSEGGRVVLDMSNITFVDSAGLGALLSAMKQITASGGSLCLAGLHDEVLTLFRLVRMNRVFEIFDTVEEAMTAES